MAQESITFNEELIPYVVDIIRLGIEHARISGTPEKRDKVKRAIVLFDEQCVELMKYWDRMQDKG